MTWRCHICGDDRPDHLIGVAKHVIVNGAGIRMEQNVRFCNDRDLCVEEARLHNLTDLALARATIDLAKCRERGTDLMTRAAILIFVAFALGFALRGAI